MPKRTSRIWELDKESFAKICHQSESLADILRYFGLHTGAGNYKTLKNRIAEDDIELGHIRLGRSNRKGKTQSPNYKREFSEVFCKDSLYKTSNQSLIARLVKSGVWEKELKCKKCDNGTTWQDEPITLQLDHINGNNTDNRVENLRILCPNCHSQTKTWGGRNIATVGRNLHCVRCNTSVTIGKGIYCSDCLKIRNAEIKKSMEKIDWPSTRNIILSIKENGWSKVARKLGVSDNAIRHHLTARGIDITAWKNW